MSNQEMIGHETRRGYNMTTFGGAPFYPLDPRAEEIDILTIAHALSNLCRYNGHTLEFYSVAQHSLLVSDLLPTHLKLVGLLHDASEAFCGDLIRPIKVALPEYKAIEQGIWLAIASRFGLPNVQPPEIKDADNMAIVIEKRDVLKPSPRVDWGDTSQWEAQIGTRKIESFMSPGEACSEFLSRFEELTGN